MRISDGSSEVCSSVLVDHSVELWPIPSSATGCFFEDAFASSIFERTTLQRGTLIIAFRDAGIADLQLRSLSSTNVFIADFGRTEICAIASCNILFQNVGKWQVVFEGVLRCPPVFQ